MFRYQLGGGCNTVRISTERYINMDDVHVITQILKYFDFEELCIAERINSYFKSCVESELYRLRYVDFDRIFTGSWMKKLTCLEIDSDFIRIFGWEKALSFVENSRNLRQISVYINGCYKCNNELQERINKVIIGHCGLMKLEICRGDDLWIDLSSCRNLTHLTIESIRRMKISEYEQLYTFLDINLNLESLNIGKVSHNKLQLIEKLMRLPKLKRLSLDICQSDTDVDEDPDLSYHRIIPDLYFVSLQNIRVDCGNLESHTKFVGFLLARSPLLKEFILEAVHSDLAFYYILFDKFPLYNQLEIFGIFFKLAYELQCFIYDELSKMVNLKYFELRTRHVVTDDVRKISKLKKLKFLQWSDQNAASLKMIHSSSSLQGLDLYCNAMMSPSATDLILDQCPNLRFFSVSFLNGEQMRKLPIRAPKLEYLRLCNIIPFPFMQNPSPIIDDLTNLVENLPNLHQLCVDQQIYNLLLRNEPIKHLFRRKRLLVLGTKANLMSKWIQLCCQEDPST
uniref:F-box domain-containing protein n=1 Tax=Romanomermis culicivorax TaxID=13658 RepID=A0A915L7I4_ROMCU